MHNGLQENKFTVLVSKLRMLVLGNIPKNE